MRLRQRHYEILSVFEYRLPNYWVPPLNHLSASWCPLIREHVTLAYGDGASILALARHGYSEHPEGARGKYDSRITDKGIAALDAFKRTQAQSIPVHTKDSDCTVVDGVCTVCGVTHAKPLKWHVDASGPYRKDGEEVFVGHAVIGRGADGAGGGLIIAEAGNLHSDTQFHTPEAAKKEALRRAVARLLATVKEMGAEAPDDETK